MKYPKLANINPKSLIDSSLQSIINPRLTPGQSKHRRIFIHLLCLLPLVIFLLRWAAGSYQGTFGVNSAIGFTGEWGVRFILIGLAITPLRVLLHFQSVMQYRRLIGIYAFFYNLLHFAVYFVAREGGSFTNVWSDIVKRPFPTTFGLIALILLFPLAITSFNSVIRWMGGKNWIRLHRCVYAIGVAGMVHYLLVSKVEPASAYINSLILVILLGIRVYWVLKKTYPESRLVNINGEYFLSLIEFPQDFPNAQVEESDAKTATTAKPSEK